MYTITDACTTCGKCLPECPVDAIEADEPTFYITDLCCDFAECVIVCPEDAIVPLEEAVESYAGERRTWNGEGRGVRSVERNGRESRRR